jgi:hypothetical protein
VFPVEEHEMEDPTDRDNPLDRMDFSEVDDRLALVADRLGGAPTAVAGLESGLVFWGLSLFNTWLPSRPAED